MNLIYYLSNHIKTDLKPSPIHGIGTFALRDIEVGEPVFYLWPNETKLYTLEKSEFESLPTYVKMMILKGFENKSEYPVIWFRLYKDCYWNLANPLAFTNTNGVDGNFDSNTRIAIKPIKEGEEILGTYNLKNTIV
jgi:hypothetical protein